MKSQMGKRCPHRRLRSQLRNLTWVLAFCSVGSGTVLLDPPVCDRCGQVAHSDEQCPSYRHARVSHPDATSRRAVPVPHIMQTDCAAILSQAARGTATGVGNNCLIDTLRQLVKKPGIQVSVSQLLNKALQLQETSGHEDFALTPDQSHHQQHNLPGWSVCLCCWFRCPGLTPL